MDILSTLWPYIDRAGAVAAIILLWQLLRSEKERIAERQARDAENASRLVLVQTMTQVIERNNAAMNQQATVLQAVLDGKLARGH